MNDHEVTDIPMGASAVSLAIALLTSAGLFFAWWVTRKVPFAIGGFGFLVVSPIWFLSPINFRSMFGPIGSRATYRRKLTPAQGLLSLAGYATILAAIVVWLREWLSA